MMIDMKGRPLKVANYNFENVAPNAADNELWQLAATSATWGYLRKDNQVISTPHTLFFSNSFLS